MVQAIKHRNFKRERLKDPTYATGYLNVALEDYFHDQDDKAFLVALRDVASAQQSMTNLSQLTKKSRQSLYKSLSEKGNPTFETLTLILKSLGLRLVVAK